MYKISELKTLLYFDIETCPEVKWGDLSEGKKKIWLDKYHYRFYPQEIEFRKKYAATKLNVADFNAITLQPHDLPSHEEIYVKYSGLMTEFSRIWCITFGMLDLKNQPTLHTLQEDDEKELISQWLQVLEHYAAYEMAGYNINDFDIPFILTRMWINGFNSNYPRQLQLKDAKPWTTKHVDFMLDWKSMKREAVSLALVCETLGVKTPKDKFENYEFTTLLMNGDITKEEGIEYCEKDVKALIECMLKCSSTNSNYSGEEKTNKKTWGKK